MLTISGVNAETSATLADEVVAIMQAEGVTDVTKLSAEAKNQVKTIKATIETNINNALNKIKKCVEIAKKLALIATAILVIVILILNCKNIIRGISQIGIVLTSSGILYIILNVLLILGILIIFISNFINSKKDIK